MHYYPPAIKPPEADELIAILRSLSADRVRRQDLSCHTAVCAWKAHRVAAQHDYHRTYPPAHEAKVVS